jgi:D-xylose transport system ATP-binding protein
MVGREIGDLFPRRSSQPGDIILQVDSLAVADTESGITKLHDIQFELRAGEVLGIGGLMGAGRTELLMHLFGAWGRRISGQVRLKGRSTAGWTPESIIQNGLVLASEDRRRYGLHLEHEIGFNLSLSSLSSVTRGGFIQRNAEIRRNQGILNAQVLIERNLDVVVFKIVSGALGDRGIFGFG